GTMTENCVRTRFLRSPLNWRLCHWIFARTAKFTGMKRYLNAVRHRTVPVSFKNVVEQQSRFAVVAPMRPLVVQAPIIGNIFGFVIPKSSKLLKRFRRILAEDFRDAAGVIKVLFEPLKDAGDFHSVLARHKTVEVFARQPGAICPIVRLAKFLAVVAKAWM